MTGTLCLFNLRTCPISSLRWIAWQHKSPQWMPHSLLKRHVLWVSCRQVAKVFTLLLGQLQAFDCLHGDHSLPCWPSKETFEHSEIIASALPNVLLRHSTDVIPCEEAFFCAETCAVFQCKACLALLFIDSRQVFQHSFCTIRESFNLFFMLRENTIDDSRMPRCSETTKCPRLILIERHPGSQKCSEYH